MSSSRSAAVSRWIACGLFLFASQVTCSAGCPLPYGETFNMQDFLHTLAAVLAFAGSCWAAVEFVATTLAIAWLVVFGAVLSARLALPSAVPEPSVA